ncbi:PadR family transcriptional regulator [Herbiconiux sp. CPCC 203407]|uniref:PadR family transcriptional regulator n=1 Tax=Herbiconiux oxytropis TaxID=2970915 RepID=A0AA41XD89_9MICO|nr:PadR family transcriptional regulator [Herbiconiux oxytropis]MCS5720518.1 PadR family transcriptional regulator [Herbiconiux oxytropis]MCS5726091.1 PadR family transcriptional regulator [Herbiconiux oxytropis]
MSVRSGILAVLGESELYGLQLHTELEARTGRVGSINVGQIYSTLERLGTAGLVTITGSTDDGLPLYGLTAEGRRAADAWLDDPTLGGVSAWGDMVFKVLLASSLRGADARPLLQGYRAAWRALPAPGDTGALGEATGLARQHLAEAALSWLDDLERMPDGLAGLRRPLRNERPRRGRRPSAPEQRDR